MDANKKDGYGLFLSGKVDAVTKFRHMGAAWVDASYLVMTVQNSRQKVPVNFIIALGIQARASVNNICVILPLTSQGQKMVILNHHTVILKQVQDDISFLSFRA